MSLTHARWQLLHSGCRDSAWMCWVWLFLVAPVSLGWLRGPLLGSQPSPGHREQILNHGRCRQS